MLHGGSFRKTAPEMVSLYGKANGQGYTIRWASYANGEFEEGVSLTCDDEINRWQKYAWGCS